MHPAEVLRLTPFELGLAMVCLEEGMRVRAKSAKALAEKGCQVVVTCSSGES